MNHAPPLCLSSTPLLHFTFHRFFFLPFSVARLAHLGCHFLNALLSLPLAHNGLALLGCGSHAVLQIATVVCRPQAALVYQLRR